MHDCVKAPQSHGDYKKKEYTRVVKMLYKFAVRSLVGCRKRGGPPERKARSVPCGSYGCTRASVSALKTYRKLSLIAVIVHGARELIKYAFMCISRIVGALKHDISEETC